MSGRPSVAAQTVTWGDFMMFKRLGILGVFAVCLFAITIVMVGCGADEDDPPPDKPIEIVTPPVELTPMEKLTGTYSLVEREAVVGVDVLESTVSGKLHLRPGGNGWLVTYEFEDGDSSGFSGPTWTANATTITFIASDGDRWVEDWTLEGKVLTLALFAEDAEDTTYIEKWRKD